MTGFTVIIGPSDRGKSAIIRALRGVLRNQVGANHITYGEKNVAVAIEINGKPIELTRNSKTTTYTVGEEEYAKLAGEVPPVVKEMGFNEVEVNGVKLDPIFAGQFDSQFMLDLSPAELNSIFGLFSSTEKLNAGKKAAASKNIEFNATARFLATEITEAEAKKGLLATLTDDIESQSQDIFSLEDTYNSVLTSHGLLLKLLEGRQKCSLLRKMAKLAIPNTGGLEETVSSGRRLVQYAKKKSSVDSLKRFTATSVPACDGLSLQLKTIIQLLKSQKISSRIQELQRLPDVALTNPLSPLLGSIKKFKTYSTGLESISEYKSTIDLSNKQLQEASTKLAELQGNSIQCPKCGHFFTGETHGHD